MNKKSFLTVLLCFVLCACSDGMTDQDRALVNKIKQHIKKKWDVVRVTDIHPGDWEKVCFTVGDGVGDDALDQVSGFSGLEKKDLKVINRNKRDTQFVEDFEWGIYFFYPPDKVEYFSIPNNQIFQGAVVPYNPYECAEKENAYFESSTDPVQNGSVSNYFRMNITNMARKDENLR